MLLIVRWLRFRNEDDCINEYWSKLNQEEKKIKQPTEIYVKKMWGQLIRGKENKSSQKENEQNQKEHKVKKF